MITRLSLVWRKVKSALFSKTSKELFIFLCFFIMSAVFWVLQALDEVREQTIDIPVAYRNVPDDVVITSNPPDVLKVLVQDNGMNLLNYHLRRSVKPVIFDFNDFEGKGYLLKMENADIQKQIIDNLNSSTKLISFKPENFDVVYTRGKAKKVPVRLTGNVTAKQQYDITNVELNPDSIMIYAPQEVLDTITAMYTNSVTYHELTDSLSFQSELQKYVNVKAVPNRVKVKIFVEQLTEKTLEVPVNAINVPEGKVLRTFPAKVKVTFQTILSYYKNVNPNNFIIQVDYNDIVKNPSSPAKPTVLAPSIIKHMRISPKEVDYLLEDEP